MAYPTPVVEKPYAVVWMTKDDLDRTTYLVDSYHRNIDSNRARRGGKAEGRISRPQMHLMAEMDMPPNFTLQVSPPKLAPPEVLVIPNETKPLSPTIRIISTPQPIVQAPRPVLTSTVTVPLRQPGETALLRPRLRLTQPVS